MRRNVFCSFHFDRDFFRVQQIRNIGWLDRNPIVTPNAWEQIKRSGDVAIKKWIDSNLAGKSCLIVLVGAQTAQRPWVQYEIKRAWELGKAVLGIRIHGLKNQRGYVDNPGYNPFDLISVQGGILTTVGSVQCYDPTGWDSKAKYNHIVNYMPLWIEQAIEDRSRAQPLVQPTSQSLRDRLLGIKSARPRGLLDIFSDE